MNAYISLGSFTLMAINELGNEWMNENELVKNGNQSNNEWLNECLYIG